MNDNLPELRDIHIPDGVSMWPPAYGWFVIAGSLFFVFMMYKIYKSWQLKSRKKYALRFLSALDETQIITSAVKISELLRRICIYRYPEAVSLKGGSWFDFLQKQNTTLCKYDNFYVLTSKTFVYTQM